ncbi:hypothetical protein PVAP13_5NG087224 [Panicum virgatum]|uniref:Uncharacterized protein n=1 Tax=Panicum virgatum TaxID=38727 RepID=A0A8T0RKY8_PANVG|nr:hypothetical protein PVAP13_5NG087224 [Panicum virgatum]
MRSAAHRPTDTAPSTSSSAPASSWISSGGGTPWPIAYSPTTARTSASSTATGCDRPGRGTTPPPSRTPTARCRGCASPPRVVRRWWTPMSRPCRFAPGRRPGSRGFRPGRSSRSASSLGSPRRCSWCA